MRYIPGQPPRKRRPWPPGPPKPQNDSFVYAGGDIRHLTSVPDPQNPYPPVVPSGAPPRSEPALTAVEASDLATTREPRPPEPPPRQSPQSDALPTRQPEIHKTIAPQPRDMTEPPIPGTQTTKTAPHQEQPTMNTSAESPIQHPPSQPASRDSTKAAPPIKPGVWGRLAAEIQSAFAEREAQDEKERLARQADLIAGRPALSRTEEPIPCSEEARAELVPIPRRRGNGPRDSLSAFTVSVARTASSDEVPPDFARHARQCSVCSHPDRDAIEADFLDWRSPKAIAQDYNLSSFYPIYRHARATGLVHRRKNEVARVMERYLERVDGYSTEEFDKVTRAIRVYSHLDDDGRWFEPPRTHYILSGRLEDLQPAPPETALPPPAQSGLPRRRQSGVRARKNLRKPK